MKPNRYPGKCVECGLTVAAGAGVLGKANGKWITTHTVCPTNDAPVVQAPTFPPTAEQQQALAAFNTGGNLVIEAGAGAGKTTTLKLLAAADTRRKVLVAFNKAIVSDVSAALDANPAWNTSASTAHSLAYRAVIGGNRALKARLNAPRQRNAEAAHILGIDPLTVEVDSDDIRTLSPEMLAGLVRRSITRFCQTADAEIDETHVPTVDGIDLADEDGNRTWTNNRLVRRHIIGAVRDAWADLTADEGKLSWNREHGVYLKLWQLSAPVIDAEVILFDECQDASPILLDIVRQQTHAQLVFVGDSQQAIYAFTGAVNALGILHAEGNAQRTFLTQSFRFGPAIAEAANAVLEQIPGAELRITGTESIDSEVVESLDTPDAILTRTNAAAVDAVLAAQANGVSVHLVGGGADVVAFAQAALDLQRKGTTQHPDLACFSSWTEVVTWAGTEDGADLALLVRLVERYSAETIISALDRQPAEADADLVVSTAHKSKGREWNRVRLAGDFVRRDAAGKAIEPTVDELRLRYVAVTRAKNALDMTALTAAGDDGEEAAA